MSATNATTTQSGTATFTVTDTTPESVTYTANDTSDSLDLTAVPVKVTFTAAAAGSTSTVHQHDHDDVILDDDDRDRRGNDGHVDACIARHDDRQHRVPVNRSSGSTGSSLATPAVRSPALAGRARPAAPACGTSAGSGSTEKAGSVVTTMRRETMLCA